MSSLISKIYLLERSKYKIIPIGTTCSISHYLRSKGLREKAFPFDWNVTPIQSAIELLQNDFEDFLFDANLIYLPAANRFLFDGEGREIEIKNDVITPVICKKYNILFPHDFSQKGEIDIDLVKIKYNKRISRLRDLLNSNIHLIFVASNDIINDWQQEQYLKATGSRLIKYYYKDWRDDLSSVLMKKYPRLDYSIYDFSVFQEETEKGLLNKLGMFYGKVVSLSQKIIGNKG